MNTLYEQAFTRKVSELIAQGYTIAAKPMGGHQGEIAKVCFYREGEYYCLALLHNSARDMEEWDTVEMVFGAAPKNYQEYDTMWIRGLEVKERQTFYVLGDFYRKHCGLTADEAEAKDAMAKRRVRIGHRYHQAPDLVLSDTKALTAAYRYLKHKVPGYRMLRMAQIKGVVCTNPCECDNRIYVEVYPLKKGVVDITRSSRVRLFPKEL